MDVQKVLQVARKEIGNKEIPAGSNRTKYGKWYGMDGVPWCAIWCSWVYHHAGYPLPIIQDGAPSGAAYCPYVEHYAKKHGQWHNKPQPGDMALFHFGKNLAVHIGIVESVNGNHFLCIEGNTSVSSNDNGGNVMRRNRTVSQCRGFYRPITTKQLVGKDAYHRLIKLQKPYMRGNDIKEWQQQAVYWGKDLDVDGIYGPNSERVCRELQQTWDLDVDGIVGPVTWQHHFRTRT